MTAEGDMLRVITRQARALESIAESLEVIATNPPQQVVIGMGDIIEGDAEKAAPDVGEYMDPPDSQPPPTDGWLDRDDDPVDQVGPEGVDWTGGSKR